MNNFETIIGIEIHLELNTDSKMFSPAPNRFNETPNTLVHPIDLGYPGTMPRVNKQAVVKAIQLAKGLNMKVDRLIRFDRKNYYYPDLPKGYQITQQFHPIGSDGFINVMVGDKEHRIDIERIHMEEDTAKQTIASKKVFYDFNRSGVPLVEIVTKPVITSAEMAIAYVDAIRKLALSLDISDARMDRGSLRADVNMSIRPVGYEGYGTRVEIKNMNSLSNIETAIKVEFENQLATYLRGDSVEQVTKRFDEASNSVKTMRSKSDAIDYRYFPEPNIPVIEISQEEIDAIKLNELPWDKEARYLNSKLKPLQVRSLVNDLQLANYFDSVSYGDTEKWANLFFSEIVSLANKEQVHVTDLGLDINEINHLLKLLDDEVISSKHFKLIIPLMYATKNSVDQIIEDNNYKLITDEAELERILNTIIESKINDVNEYPTKPERVLKLVLGLLMKETNAQAHPVIAQRILVNLLKTKYNV